MSSKDTRFKPGQSGNPKGRPVGSKDFRTLYKEAIKKLAEEGQIDPEAYEVEIVMEGLKRAKKDYKFYKDTQDRIHGKPKEHVDHTSGGEKIAFITNNILAERDDIIKDN